MKEAILVAFVASLALTRGYVETGHWGVDPRNVDFYASVDIHDLLAGTQAGKYGPICKFEVEFATPGSKLGVTRDIQATVIDILMQGVNGIILCKAKTVTSQCYSISMHGITVQGCLAELGLICLSRKKVSSCDALDPLPIIGTTFPTQYGNATITKASVCGRVNGVPLTVYDLVDEEKDYHLAPVEAFVT